VLNSELLAACTRIRRAAEEFMDERDLVGLGWDEESVTNVSIHRGLPEVRVVQFNRTQEGGRTREEGGVGADYLWWWLDETSAECFGMLVQAKRLRIDSRGWSVDIAHGKGQQLKDLLDAARQFRVPAMYAVYTGGRVFRRETACVHDATPSTCLGCRRMAISMVGAYQLATTWESPRTNGLEVFNSSISLEDLVDPSRSTPDLIKMELGPELPTTLSFFVQDMTAEMESFLTDGQVGPREIAKRIFEAVVRQRIGSFRAGTAEQLRVRGEPIFHDVPQDIGHYPGPYFEHFLRGLQSAPPSYVIDALEGRDVPDEVSSQMAGLVLVTV